jgi:hypothetical protein
MRLPRVRYSVLTLIVLVAAFAAIMGAVKAVERERARTSLCRERLQAAEWLYQDRLRRYRSGLIALEEFYPWSVRVMQAQQDLNNTWSGRLKAAEDHQQRIAAIMQAMSSLGGCLSEESQQQLRYYVKDAEYMVATAR